MTVTLEHLRIFKAAAETLNFTKAAEKCYITQPALSRTISALEEEWQTALFDRTTRRVRLTPEGERCLARVSAILREYDGLMEDFHHAVSGEMHIGFNTLSGPPEWFVSALKELRDEYPGVRFRLLQERSTQAVRELVNGDLDCALIYEHSALQTKGLRTHRLVNTRRYAVVPRADPLAALSAVELSLLATRRLVFMKDLEAVTYQEMTELLSPYGPRKPDITVNSLAEMLLETELTGGVGITGLDSGGNQPDFRFIPLSLPDSESYRHGLALAAREQDRNQIIQSFLQKLEHHTKDL